tara:strand:- start:8321 stop:8611 length:291 start_codon:yes stop_codon:yes gene_type:complete
MEITALVSLSKGKCIARMQADLQFGVGSLEPDGGVFYISWKTNNSKTFKFPEALQLIEFHSLIDYEYLYSAVITDVSHRICSTKKFPQFDWTKGDG